MIANPFINTVYTVTTSRAGSMYTMIHTTHTHTHTPLPHPHSHTHIHSEHLLLFVWIGG